MFTNNKNYSIDMKMHNVYKKNQIVRYKNEDT